LDFGSSALFSTIISLQLFSSWFEALAGARISVGGGVVGVSP